MGRGSFFHRWATCTVCVHTYLHVIIATCFCIMNPPPPPHTALIGDSHVMGWGSKAIEIRAVENGQLDGVFMHKRIQKLRFLCERNDKVKTHHWSVYSHVSKASHVPFLLFLRVVLMTTCSYPNSDSLVHLHVCRLIEHTNRRVVTIFHMFT